MAKFDVATKLWETEKVPYPYPMDKFLGEIILENLKETPDRICQICHDDGQELTCNELRVKSIRVAQNLLKLGIKSNDTVGIVCGLSNEVSCLLFACIYIGATVNALDVTLGKEDIKQMFGQTMPKIVFCDSDVVTKVQEALTELKNDAQVLSMPCDKNDDNSNFAAFFVPTKKEKDFVPTKFQERADEKSLAIAFSSGSTGSPKGLLYTHARALSEVDLIKNDAQTITLTVHPLFWVVGIISQLDIAFKTNDVKLITRKILNFENFSEMVQKWNPTVMNDCPMNVSVIVKSNLANVKHKSLKQIISMGSIHSETLRRRFSEVFPEKDLTILYGMTETNTVSWTGSGEFKQKYSVGSNFSPNFFMKIVDENGKKLGPNEQGELCIKRRDFPFQGYYKNPEASKDANDDEGFYKSGDIAYFDNQGMLFIVDRKKQIIKSQCFQVNLGEIESLIESIEGVKFVSVVAIPDDDADNLLAAVVVKNSEDITEATISEYAAKRLVYFKHLSGGVHFVDKLPTTPNGKINKRLVTEVAKKKIELNNLKF